jgi:putative transcriptional regulator
MKAREKQRDSSQGRRSTRRIGPRLVGALTDLRDSLRRGERFPAGSIVKTLRLPEPPGRYSAMAVRRTRLTLGATQAQYAALLGVSLDQVRSMEQGRRKPAGSVRRLLDLMNDEPQRWSKLLAS